MKKAIIIGSGIAGLSAGCYLQMNGYETEIFEMHWQAGGLCQAWRRKEYLVDGCIHWFVGLNPSSYLYNIWNGLVDMKTLPMVVYNEFCSVDYEDKITHFYSDVEELNKELKEISPQDSIQIDKLTAAMKRFSSFQIYQDETGAAGSFINKIKKAVTMISFVCSYLKWKMPLEKYALKFKSQQIRHFLVNSLGEKTPTWIMLINAASFDNKDAGYPAGGANELVQRIVNRYVSLGGKIHYNSKVTKITVEDNIAKGIELENGETSKADIVISAADGRFTVQEMLAGKYQDKHIKKLYYSGKYDPKESGFHVALGVAREIDESHKPYVFFDMRNPLKINGEEIKKLGVTIYNFDPKAAPKGKTVMTAIIPSKSPNHWVNLRNQNKPEYEKQKEAIAKHVIDEIDNYFGNIKNNLEMTDVATPATYVRYTNNWNGALMGWTDLSLLMHRPKKEIKGLNNFYMFGQWVGDVGLPGAAKSGKDISQIICKKDKIEFKVLAF